ncbi:MAG: hypothetical protein ACR2Q4_22675 [Geminicoccaceae bacterium]
MKCRPSGRAGNVAILMVASFAFYLLTGPVQADEDAIAIELNKTESTEQGCRPHFLFNNQSGHQLNQFQVELVLFDQTGVYAKQIRLDMAPLYEGKKVLASFLLDDIACDQIGSMLVNDLPKCANSTGTDLDCLSLLQVSSKSDIALEQ